MAYVHLVAHIRRGGPMLWDHDLVQRLWNLLRGAFPNALGAGILPEHVHLVEDGPDEEACWQLFHRTLKSFAWGMGHVWDKVPRPKVLLGTQQLTTELRYVGLNPCKDRRVADPLEWLWSTHRDLMGAVADPWVTPGRLAPHLRKPVGGFRESWHKTVSKDRYVTLPGTSLPIAEPPCDRPARSIDHVMRAAASATRMPLKAIARRTRARWLFLALARRQGWNRTATLAEACGISPQAVRKSRVAVS